MTVGQAVAAAAARLAEVGIPDAPRDARRLVAHALGVAPDRLTLNLGEVFVAEAELEAALGERLRRRPLSQIVGWREFYGRRFTVTSDVLDPRPETETLVEVALGAPYGNVLDLGTGSGCILLTLMAERPGTVGTGTDRSAAALAVARRNAVALGLAPRFVEADWWEGLDERWDLVVSNPPYVSAAEYARLAPELAWEPREALFPGGDGLDAYRAIAAGACARLRPGGRIALEIGQEQATAVAALLSEAGLGGIAVARDLDGRDRVVSARAPNC